MTYDSILHEVWSESCTALKRTFYGNDSTSAHSVEAQVVVENNENIMADCIILPDLCAHLIVHQSVEKNQPPRFSLVGPRSKSIRINHHGRSKTSIVRLKPGGVKLESLFSPAECIDQCIAIGEFATESSEWLQEQVASEQKAASVLGELVQLAAYLQPAGITKTWNGLVSFCQTPDRLTVKEAARYIGISDRGLHKACTREVGMSTSEILNIVRLRRALYHTEMTSSRGWAHIAVASGYYDQSHMIADFQKLIGSTPGQLFG